MASLHALFLGSCSPSSELQSLFDDLTTLPEMNKHAMSGRCMKQTDRMKQFMKSNFQMQHTGGSFVDGVREFVLNSPVDSKAAEEDIVFANKFHMRAGEIQSWQRTYQVFADRAAYPEESEDDAKKVIQRALMGQCAQGNEAWRMKFVVRVAQTAIVCEFDGVPIERGLDEEIGSVYLMSTCGMDFAGRIHDIDDVKTYITNWRKVFVPDREDPDSIYVYGGRDLVNRPRVRAILNEELFLEHAKKMARIRLSVADSLGVQVAVEVAIGLGVFSGDHLGIGMQVRLLTARALRETLEEMTFQSIQAVVIALPIFRPNDNYFAYEYVFADEAHPYTGATPVLLIDQDMHRLARAAAVHTVGDRREARYVVSELNPGDSHGVFGEYWENYGPGTEEKLALTTTGLLTQHHAVNPHVLSAEHYHFL